MLVLHTFISFFADGVRCFEDEDDEQRLIETALLWGWKWLFPIWSLKFLNPCIQTPGLLISYFNSLYH
jgi:hypothetical protein